ncbi:NAD(P)/FAD-dependent oxidoreductase [Actinomadura sp. 21ATH]|uniref:NAD(P)/FAD-dependent oxidoreductase n=1 Tax=Actinomadura sp. 21ATH TaxID=1735444 RepID=UPI0035C1A2F7
MTGTVVIVGGGYGGVAVAKELDEVADVVLVEPRDAFVHNAAALRGLVDPQWTDRLFFPYEKLLARGRVVRDRAASVDGTTVTLGSGERIEADYVVLATGSGYPFPAKFEIEDSTAAKAAVRAAHGELAGAGRVLLLGAGPVGLELAGEIKHAWPDKAVTLVDPAGELMGAFPDEFRDELRRQLAALGIEVLLGTGLAGDPPSRPGTAEAFTVTTADGAEISADLWFRCFGVAPQTGYLNGELAEARRGDGFVEVTPELRVAGQERVFALGDITAVPEAKTAANAGRHAEVVAANVRALLRGAPADGTYAPAGPMIAMPLGPEAGLSYTPEMGVLDAETTAQIKGRDMMIEEYLKTFNLV